MEVRGAGGGSTRVVQAVPNFSEGRDPDFVAEVAGLFAGAGCEVLDVTSDPDHNRGVVTVIGPPRSVEDGAVEAARFALEHIDLRLHRGVHPRVGALDVLPFVPLRGMEMSEAAALARRAGGRIARMGIPAYLYGEASRPPGRALASIRGGGFEALVAAEDRSAAEPAPAPVRGRGSEAPVLREGDGRVPADLPGLDGEGRPAHLFAHPTAGAACVGARGVLLAWNVDVEGVSLKRARTIALAIRESGGGFSGLRALAFHLPRQGRTQVSMSLERPDETDPLEVFAAIEAGVERVGGRVAGVELIGMAPDAVTDSVARAMAVRDWSPARMLSRRFVARAAADPDD